MSPARGEGQRRGQHRGSAAEQRRSTHAGAPVLVLLTSILVACGEAGGSGGSDEIEPTFSVRDSAGIQIVENGSSGRWAPGEGWRVDSLPVIDLGRISGPAPQQFDGVVGVVRLSDGRIAVADGGSEEIRVFGPDGRHVRTVGGKGGGPGEFEVLAWLGTMSGDTLVAWDRRAKRMSVFGPDGELIRSASAEKLSGFGARIEGVFDDGSFVAVPGPDIRALFDAEDGEARDTTAYLRYAASGALLDTLAHAPGAERYVVHAGGGLSIKDIMFGRGSYAAVRGDRLYVGTSGRFEIEIHDPEGQLRRVVRKQWKPRRVGSAEVEHAREALLAGVEDLPRLPGADVESRRRRQEEMIQQLPHRETFPAFQGLLVDDEGNLWVERFRPPWADERDPAIWDVFDPDGRLLGAVRTPAGLHIDQIGADFVLGAWYDAYDVAHVLLYGLVKQVEKTG